MRVAWYLLSFWIVIFTSAVIFALLQDQRRQNEIHRESVRSCIRTYTIITRILLVTAPAVESNGHADINERWLFLLQLANPRHCLSTIP